jgi:hypothetical protein
MVRHRVAGAGGALALDVDVIAGLRELMVAI